VINAKHGIGAGILINGRLFQGDGGGAGEIGHVVVQEDGLACRCGKRGCLETVASARAVVERARDLAVSGGSPLLSKDPASISLDSVLSAFDAGDPLAVEVVMDAARYLGYAIAGLVGTLNIHKIVLTGDMTRFGKSWLEAVRRSMLKSALASLANNTQVEIGMPDVEGCILGASALLLLDGYSMLFSQTAPRQLDLESAL
jgi:predicted NBD/HSP70 family sugar kinase